MPFYAPPVFLTPEDHALLSQVVAEHRADSGCGLLANEIRRAVLVPARRLSQETVRLNSTVVFIDNDELEIGSAQVVLPEAVSEEGQCSVTSPMGAALIGLRQGDTMSWTDGGPTERVVTVTRVEGPRSKR